jgi:hypothetical protein
LRLALSSRPWPLCGKDDDGVRQVDAAGLASHGDAESVILDGSGEALTECVDVTPPKHRREPTLGVPEAVVAPFCTEIGSGQRWRVSQGWVMGLTFKKVPKGFEPAGATPLEDFIAKFIGVKLVVDPGTAQEQTYVFTNADDVGMIAENGFDVVNTVTMGTLEPLSVGRHVVTGAGLHGEVGEDPGARPASTAELGGHLDHHADRHLVATVAGRLE